MKLSAWFVSVGAGYESLWGMLVKPGIALRDAKISANLGTFGEKGLQLQTLNGTYRSHNREVVFYNLALNHLSADRFTNFTLSAFTQSVSPVAFPINALAAQKKKSLSK